MRRCARVLVLVAVAGWVTADGSTSRAAQLLIDAPGACADPASLADEVGNLVGRPLAEVADVDFRLRVTEGASGHWRLRLEMLDQKGAGGAPSVRGSRKLEGTSCAELVEAAAVAIAVSVRSLQAEPPAEAPHPAAPPPTAEAARAPVVSALAATPPPPAPPPWRLAVALAAVLDIGTLPSVSPGAELDADLQRGALRLTVLGAWFESQDAVGSNDAGGRFQLAMGGALACFAPPLGRWTPLACGGVELGRLAGTGLLVARPETGVAFWRAARAEAGVKVSIGGDASALVRAGVAVPLTRPDFVLDGSSPVFQPDRLAARLTVGLELGF
ncbi:MAG TPA: hypothetical protein VKZ18_21475 [Polyangia bacterium]|nr:hypothetical protein [Polyangia bacterium]